MHKVNWFYRFGALTFIVFVLQIVSGMYLALFFQATPEGAWKSIEFIEHSLAMGKFARSLHRWGAFVMMLLLLMHILRVMWHRAYRSPRVWNWMSGLVLLLLTMAFIVTGYILPWDFRAYWVNLVMANWLNSLPLFSGALRWFLSADAVHGFVPVGRWLVIHIAVLPFLSGLGLFCHFSMLRKHGLCQSK